MKIGLLDIDGHNFPNLALMKISAWHKSMGHSVEFATMFETYDILYKSKIFFWTVDPDYCYRAKKIIRGGSGFDLKSRLSDEIDRALPDYELYRCESAYGFLTRGCPNKCSWCIVPEKEGDIKPYMDIDEIIGNYKSAVLLDNNVLASPHGIAQIEKIIKMKIKIDFNQGLDARLIDNSIAKLLSKVKWIRFIRMACDSPGSKQHIENAVREIRKYTKREIFVYTLIRKGLIDEAMDRIMFLKNLGVTPFAQPYRDRDGGTVEYERRKLARWVNLKKAFMSMSYEDFKRSNL